MAFFTMKLQSQTLASPTTVRLFLPCDLENNPPIPGVTTLLHGFTNDGDDWVNKSAALRYAGENSLALIIPDAANSFYNDMAAGPAYYTWLTEELPMLLRRMVNLPAEREKNAVCGLSMGGYGALLLGLSKPERYFACASFSGVVHLGMMLQVKHNPMVQQVFSPVFGLSLSLPENRDIFRLAERAAALPEALRPRILCTSGKQDIEPYYVYNQNIALAEHMADLPLDFEFRAWDGLHEWSVWDRSLALAIDRFFVPGYADKVKAAWTAE